MSEVLMGDSAEVVEGRLASVGPARDGRGFAAVGMSSAASVQVCVRHTR